MPRCPLDIGLDVKFQPAGADPAGFQLRLLPTKELVAHPLDHHLGGRYGVWVCSSLAGWCRSWHWPQMGSVDKP
jgi:hypothetical protein